MFICQLKQYLTQKKSILGGALIVSASNIIICVWQKLMIECGVKWFHKYHIAVKSFTFGGRQIAQVWFFIFNESKSGCKIIHT